MPHSEKLYGRIPAQPYGGATRCVPDQLPDRLPDQVPTARRSPEDGRAAGPAAPASNAESRTVPVPAGSSRGSA